MCLKVLVHALGPEPLNTGTLGTRLKRAEGESLYIRELEPKARVMFKKTH